MNKIKIPGHSGSDVIVEFKNKCGLYVKKVSSNDRLMLQADKQRLFISENDHLDIVSPRIIKNCFLNTSGTYEFHMSYITGLDMISFICQSSIDDVEEFTLSLFSYFDKIIHDCEVKYVVNKVLLKKIKSVSIELFKNPLIQKNNKSEFLINVLNRLDHDINSREVNLPKGICHGDLTFSNMMYNIHTRKIVVFDFLDTYFESPIQDMIKIKQDLAFNWTFQKFPNKKDVDKKRFNIVRSYLDNEFENYFKSFKFYNENYKVLQIINLLRILVYSKDCKTISYLLECIKRL